MGRIGIALIVGLALVAPARLAGEADKYDVYAVRFATLVNFPVSSLVAGADRARRMDIAMMIWVLKGADGRIALVDSGFHREQYFRQFTVRDYVKPSEAIAPLGLKPGDITDIFLTHMHWDHAGGIDLFPSARVWIQKDEYDYYTGDAWQSARTHGGIDADDVLEIVKRNTQGKVSFVRKPRHACADCADVGSCVEPARARSHALAGRRAAAADSGTRSHSVREVSKSVGSDRPNRVGPM